MANRRRVGTIFDTNGVRGNVAELGVHHGLFLFLLTTLRNDGEECFAIDVFDEQRLNVDQSGRGSLAAFLSHLETLLPAERDCVRIVQRDATGFSTREFTELFGKTGVKFFSIDAGHTILHDCNDLHVVQEVLAPGGIVALDDYMSVHWPGVTEGFYRFMYTQNRRLRPLVEQVEGLGEFGIGKRQQSDEARLGEEFLQSANCRDANTYAATSCEGSAPPPH